MSELQYQLNEIEEVAQSIAKQMQHPIILFKGQMGAGKTTFVQALIKQLGFETKASSPTFSLVNEYHNQDKKVFHFDLYRINSLQEALDFGFEEYLDSGHYCFIEWPEHIIKLLDNYHIIHIQITCENKRLLVFQ